MLRLKLFATLFFLLINSPLRAQVDLLNWFENQCELFNLSNSIIALNDESGNYFMINMKRNVMDFHDIELTKFTASGQQAWKMNYSGFEWDNQSFDGAVDKEGNLYVMIKTMNESLNYDMTILKYKQNGQQDWEKVVLGSDYDDHPLVFELDDRGNVFALGFTYDVALNRNICLTGLDSEGNTFLRIENAQAVLNHLTKSGLFSESLLNVPRAQIVGAKLRM